MHTHSARLLWLDLLRTAAILGMIVYHGAYDLQFFHEWSIDVTHGAWKLFQIAIASIFLAVSGISAGFWTRSTNAHAKALKRGVTILVAACAVSIVTYLVDPETWVRFGILHLIGVTSFVLPLLRRLHPAIIALLGIACIALLPFDLMPHVVSVDYVPPVPWLGPVLLGFAIGIPLSKHAPSQRRGQDRPLLDCVCWPGRHSLWIYLLHQPVLVAVLWLALSR
jgi:uncharacterized membrane protein